MNAVTVKEAKLKLEQLLAQVIADAEATIVVTENGDQVVVLPLDEYNSWKETLSNDEEIRIRDRRASSPRAATRARSPRR